MTRVFDAYAAFYDALYREKNYASEVDFILEMIGHRDSASRDVGRFGVRNRRACI